MIPGISSFFGNARPKVYPLISLCLKFSALLLLPGVKHSSGSHSTELEDLVGSSLSGHSRVISDRLDNMTAGNREKYTEISFPDMICVLLGGAANHTEEGVFIPNWNSVFQCLKSK